MNKIKNDQIDIDQKLTLGKMAKDPLITLEDFKTFCVDVINQGVSSRVKKDTFIRDVQKANRKDLAAWPVYSYILAGEGNKVA